MTLLKVTEHAELSGPQSQECRQPSEANASHGDYERKRVVCARWLMEIAIIRHTDGRR